MAYSKQIEDFLGFLRDAEINHNIAVSTEKDMGAATQDLLHRLELGNDKYHDVARLSKALRNIRQKRRTAKDEAAVTGPIVAWIEQNRKVISSIERLLGEVRKAEKSTENRFYTPKTDIVEKTLGGGVSD